MGAEIIIEDKRSASLVPAVEEVNPSSLMYVMEKFATNPNLDADKIERLFNIFIDGQRKMRIMNDEQEFAHRMADFKTNPPDIFKNRTAKMSGTAKGSGKEYSLEISYADLDAYASAIMGGLAERGITWSFPFSESDRIITVSCILRYGLYQTTPTTFSGPPEESGVKNPLQAKGSTLSYLERYTLCGATGFTAGMPDTDGNTSGLSAETREGYLRAIQTAPDAEALKTVYLAASKAATDAKDTPLLRTFGEAKNSRYKQLAKEPANA